MILNDALSIEEIDELISHERIHNIVISPGPGTPCCPKDAGITLQIFEAYKHMPILGVCFGFQTLCYVHGNGSVIKAPEPVHGRITAVEHGGDDLFKGIPTGKDFEVVRYHSLCVDACTLNDDVIPLAWCESRGHHAVSTGSGSIDQTPHQEDDSGSKILMAARHRQYPHYGVQFHPESIATKYGDQLLDNFRRISLEHVKSLMPEITHGISPARMEINPRDVSFLPPSKSDTLHVTFDTLEGLACDIQGGISQLVDSLFAEKGGTENLFWLDSASKERTRFSFVGATGGSLWRRVSYKLNKDDNGGILRTFYPEGTSEDAECASIFEWINQEMAVFTNFDDAFRSFPFEFWEAWLGILDMN